MSSRRFKVAGSLSSSADPYGKRSDHDFTHRGFHMQPSKTYIPVQEFGSFNGCLRDVSIHSKTVNRGTMRCHRGSEFV